MKNRGGGHKVISQHQNIFNLIITYIYIYIEIYIYIYIYIYIERERERERERDTYIHTYNNRVT